MLIYDVTRDGVTSLQCQDLKKLTQFTFLGLSYVFTLYMQFLQKHFQSISYHNYISIDIFSDDFSGYTISAKVYFPQNNKLTKIPKNSKHCVNLQSWK